MKLLGATQNEIIGISQVLNFYNGIKSTTKELVRSVMIYCDQVFESDNLNKTDKANHILSIATYFFLDEFNESNKTRNTLTFNKTHIAKPWRVKTILHEVPIFAFKSKKSNDFLQELYEIGFNDMMGFQNLFEPDNPTIDDVSNIYISRIC